jgi:two-component system nitrate/nitrite response regulator NarL
VLVVDDHTLFRRGLIALLAGDARFRWWARPATPTRRTARGANCSPT